jgi:hypothetical protein
VTRKQPRSCSCCRPLSPCSRDNCSPANSSCLLTSIFHAHPRASRS